MGAALTCLQPKQRIKHNLLHLMLDYAAKNRLRVLQDLLKLRACRTAVRLTLSGSAAQVCMT